MQVQKLWGSFWKKLKKKLLEKLLDQVIEARNKAALAELERKHDEDIASSHSADSVKEQFKTLCFFMLI